MVTDRGNIHCEHIVNAAGLWAREVGAMAGVHVPIVPMEHHYLLTEPLDELTRWDSELPLVLDLDGEMYLRQEQNGVLLGVYERNSTPWSVNGTSWEFGETDLLEVRLDDIADALTRDSRDSRPSPKPASGASSTGPSRSPPTATPSSARYGVCATTGPAAVSWRDSARAAAWRWRFPNG